MKLEKLIRNTANLDELKQNFRKLNKDQLRVLSHAVIPKYQNGKYWEDQKNKYRSPVGYTSWNRHLGYCLFHSSDDAIRLAETSRDSAGLAVSTVCGLSLHRNAPARYISRELCQSFLRTSCPRIEDEMLDVFPCVHILLPEGLLTSDEGLNISALVIQCGKLFPVMTPEQRSFAQRQADKHGMRIIPPEVEGARGIAVGAITDIHAYSWISFVDEELNRNYQSPTKPDTEVRSLTDAIGRIAVNSLLVHLYEPELITTDKSLSFRSGTGFCSQDSSSRTLPATWIGKSFRSVSDRERPRSEGPSRGPVQPHWRRGHWHTVLHGPRRSERRMQWFRPVYVNGST
jgi:hypothetical protein